MRLSTPTADPRRCASTPTTTTRAARPSRKLRSSPGCAKRWLDGEPGAETAMGTVVASPQKKDWPRPPSGPGGDRRQREEAVRAGLRRRSGPRSSASNETHPAGARDAVVMRDDQVWRELADDPAISEADLFLAIGVGAARRLRERIVDPLAVTATA